MCTLDADPFSELSEIRDTIQKGKALEIQRPMYNHWALYIGDGEVVHVTGCEAHGDVQQEMIPNSAHVCLKDLKEVVGEKGRLRVRNEIRPSFDADLAVKSALNYVGKEVPFNVLSQNCKDHVKSWLKEGVAESPEAEMDSYFPNPFRELSEIRDSIQKGDALEIQRSGNNHWALYIGNGKVVHVTGRSCHRWFMSLDDVQLEMMPNYGHVRLEDLTEVVGEKSRVRVHKEIRPSFDADLAVKSALSDVGKKMYFNLLSQNCKNFVNSWIWDGVPASTRAKMVRKFPDQFRELCKIQDSIKKGDALEIERPDALYKQWALYIGNGQVVHVTGGEGELSSMPLMMADKTYIRVEKLTKVVGGSKLRVHNEIPPGFNADLVVKRALNFVDKVVPYDLIQQNCQYYVKRWMN